MYIIRHAPEAATTEIKNFLWKNNGYKPQTFVSVNYDNLELNVRFRVMEANPRTTITRNLGPVNLDSCVEFFAVFMPGKDPRYMNFELNSAGFINASVRTSRYDGLNISADDIKSMNINASSDSISWEVAFSVPYILIKKYYKHFEPGSVIYGNFYKCGDECKFEHYGSYTKIFLRSPEFHCPEFFAKMVFEHPENKPVKEKTDKQTERSAE